MNTLKIRRQNGLIVDLEKVVWSGKIKPVSISLSQSLIKNKVLMLFSSIKAKSGEKVAEV